MKHQNAVKNNNNSTWTVAKILRDFHNENKGWSRGRKG